ncbi:MAG: hypothetical protein MUE45_02735 [Methanoregulaceae archaeon]|nr:hypothetical protein [Methanoregulaceae archaeon]
MDIREYLGDIILIIILCVHHKIRTIELNITNRERMIRVSLEEISAKMAQRYESSIERIEGIVTEVAKRVYR